MYQYTANAALMTTALSFSPQMPIGADVGTILHGDAHIPPGVEYVDETHFRVNFYAPAAVSVALRTPVGDLPLDKQESGVWSAMLENGEGGFSPISFVVDGVNVLNPMAPVGVGASAAVNTLDLPQPGVDFYCLKNVPHGTVSQEYYNSSVTGRTETCLVYTPPNYIRSGETHPVLYLQHGHGENETCWVHHGKVNFIMDNLLAVGKAAPCIIVMNNGMVQTKGTDGLHIDATLLPDILIHDCIPFIERTYHVKKGRENRAMAGLSMGSLQTSITVLSHPELFSWAGVFSGFVQPLPTLMKCVSHLAALDDAARFTKDYRLFFRAIGEKDPFGKMFASDSALFAQKELSPDKCPVHLERKYPGGHEWNVWRLCARDFLQLIFQQNR